MEHPSGVRCATPRLTAEKILGCGRECCHQSRADPNEGGEGPSDPDVAWRVMRAMMQVRKIDIAALERAALPNPDKA